MQAKAVGMIGIGQLGLAIATNLMAAGFEVAGYRRTHREEFVRRGGTALGSASEVAQKAQVVLLCLSSEGSQRDILEGSTGLLQALTPHHTVVELGTYSREFKLSQARAIEAVGARTLECEVSGTPAMVVDRRASLFLGGNPKLITEVEPLLDAIAETHFHIGEYGSAVTMKVIANYLLAIHTLAAAEAINLGVRAGFTAHRVVEVIQRSAGNSVGFTARGPKMAARTFETEPGPIELFDKYIELGSGLAAQTGAAAPLFSAAASYFRRALTAGIAKQDLAAVLKLIEADSNPPPQQAAS